MKLEKRTRTMSWVDMLGAGALFYGINEVINSMSSLGARMVKNLLAMQETQVPFLGYA